MRDETVTPEPEPAGPTRADRRAGDRMLGRALGQRAFWQVRLRWWVPPAIVVSLAASWALGFQVETGPILAVAAAILLYNIPFALASARDHANPGGPAAPGGGYTLLQVALDYTAVFLLVHFTGGAASPLVFFFLFHVVAAAILLRASTAYLFAVVAAVGMWLLAAAEGLGWLAWHPVLFRGEARDKLERPGHVAAQLAFFSATVVLVAAAATRIMATLRQRVIRLAQSKDEIAELNERLSSIYDVLTVLGSETDLRRVLDVVTSSLAGVMGVRAASVKLLSDDRRTLRYVAVHGLPQEFLAEQVIDVAQTPLNRRVVEGETLVYGDIMPGSGWQLQEALAALGVRSLLLAPLTVHRRVIGVLGAYCDIPSRFDPEDARFFKLAAELVAIAIEHARRHQEVQHLMDDRLRFMFRVAHNMRAPLGAGVSMLNVLSEGYLGEVPPRQADHLSRVIRRLRSLDTAVSEILTLARCQMPGALARREPVEIGALAARVAAAFKAQADERGVLLRLAEPAALLPVNGDPHLLEQVLENLVSNALKYTPAGGEVSMTTGLGPGGSVVVAVRDTGIGIPADEQAKLFEEFFRASNARKTGEPGTGLGLRLVREVVEKHGGEVRLESEEGRGTLVEVELPAAGATAEPAADVAPAR